MEYVEPKIYHLGAPSIDREGLQAFLNDIGAPEWKTNAPSDQEEIIEVMGRLCYRSFAVGLNPNITKIREGNDVYLANIENSGHGSVIEHGMENYIIRNCSRVFTHELVRHRAGTAFSQESMRYVRIDELKFWFPKVFADHPKAEVLRQLSNEALLYLEQLQRSFASVLDIENVKDFDTKKQLTSAMRRWAPDGLATAIGLSINPRAARHVVQMRTASHAEEEIRLIWGLIYKDLKSRYPNLYQDSQEEMVKGFLQVTFKNEKI